MVNKPKRKSVGLVPDDIPPENQKTRLVDEDASEPVLVTSSKKKKSVVERGIEELQRQGYSNIQAEMFSSGDYSEVAL